MNDKDVIYKADEPSSNPADIHSIELDKNTNELHIKLNGSLDNGAVQKAIFNRRVRGRVEIKSLRTPTYMDKRNFKRLKNGGDYIVEAENEYGDRPGEGVLSKKSMTKALNNRGRYLNIALKRKDESHMKKPKINKQPKTSLKRNLRTISMMERDRGYKIARHNKKKEPVQRRGWFRTILHYLNPFTYVFGVINFIRAKVTSKKAKRTFRKIKSNIWSVMKVTILLPIIFIIKLVQRRFVNLHAEGKIKTA